MITNNCVKILVIYNPFNAYGISGSNIQHSMLDLLKYDSVLIYNEHQENIANNYVSIFGNLQ